MRWRHSKTLLHINLNITLPKYPPNILSQYHSSTPWRNQRQRPNPRILCRTIKRPLPLLQPKPSTLPPLPKLQNPHLNHLNKLRHRLPRIHLRPLDQQIPMHNNTMRNRDIASNPTHKTDASPWSKRQNRSLNIRALLRFRRRDVKENIDRAVLQQFSRLSALATCNLHSPHAFARCSDPRQSLLVPAHSDDLRAHR